MGTTPYFFFDAMMWSSSKEDSLNIRVEKGTKPRLKLSEDKRNVQVAVPLDTFVNYPLQRVELHGGYYLVLQRLQQQYKITVQHGHERKPEFVIYSSAQPHEKDIKTQVKEMNTRIHKIGIAGPNLDVFGALRAARLTLEATVGTMHVNAKVTADRLSLHGQSIVVAPEALISTDKFTQYREKREQSTLNRVRERITLINALLAVRDWRRGSIQAKAIRAIINKNCDDCAQFNAKELQIKVGGSAIVEPDSIWSSTYVELDAWAAVTICGQVKLTSLVLTAGKALTTTADAIVALEMFGRLNVGRIGDVYCNFSQMEMVSGAGCVVDGSWQIGTCWALIEAKLTIGASAKLFVEESATIGALGCLRRCQYDGYLKANEVEIYLPYMDESQMIVTGQMDILVSPLTLKGNSSFYNATPTNPHPYPAFILDGRLNAHAIIAPFLAVELSPESLLRLCGITSFTPAVDFNILVSAGALATGKNCTLLSMGDNPRAEGIICASTFYHQGQIRFQAEDVHILTGALVHKGRLTNCEHKQNHVKNCHIVVEELFLNEGTLACNVLDITGEGVLDNKNRIFAVDSMDIRLNNFHNDEGLMESKNHIKLLSATKEWTKLGGSIKAKKGFDLYANKLDMALNDVHKLMNEKKLSFSARSDLIISTDICDEVKEFAVGCAAQNSVAINAVMDLDRLEVLLGGDHTNPEPVLFKVTDRADININTLVINGTASHLMIVLDGLLKCNRVKIAESFKHVTVS
ncbi:hypothetical protein OESDEN_05349, partial [Oesophagostomum dentatum]